MMRLKACPRCGGDVIVESDLHGWYELCLQCGFQRDLPNMAKSQFAPSKAKKRVQG